MTPVLRARRLLTEEGWLDDHQLRIADGVIAAIEPIPVGVTERDAELLCPACILVLRYHEQRIDLAKRMQPGAP